MSQPQMDEARQAARYIPNRSRTLLRMLTAGIGTKLPWVEGQSMSAPPPISDVYLFRYRESIVDFDAQIPNRALDLGVAK